MTITDSDGKSRSIYNGTINPKPSTPRGKRRHAARSEGRKLEVAEIWREGANSEKRMRR